MRETGRILVFMLIFTGVAGILVIPQVAHAQQWRLWSRAGHPSLEDDMTEWHETSGRFAPPGSGRVFLEVNLLPTREKWLVEARGAAAQIGRF